MKRLCAACMLWAMAVRPAATLHAAEVYNYWIEPCTADASARSGCNAADPELASWALEAWQKAGGSGLRFAPAGAENEARVRIYWLGRKPQLYGDAHVVFLIHEIFDQEIRRAFPFWLVRAERQGDSGKVVGSLAPLARKFGAAFQRRRSAGEDREIGAAAHFHQPG